jgi:CTP:molybdopterin cytidylyltransferase MocA
MPPYNGAYIGMTSSESAAARESAHQLLTCGALGAADTPGAAMERAYARIANHLKRSVGDDGYAALHARALVRAPSGEPVSLLAAVIDILSDLVGEDMARSLFEPNASSDAIPRTQQ